MTTVPLPDDHLACYGCGVAVPTPADPSLVVVADCDDGEARGALAVATDEPTPATEGAS